MLVSTEWRRMELKTHFADSGYLWTHWTIIVSLNSKPIAILIIPYYYILHSYDSRPKSKQTINYFKSLYRPIEIFTSKRPTYTHRGPKLRL